MLKRTPLCFFENRATQVAKLYLDRGEGHKLIQQHASRELDAFRHTFDAMTANPNKATRRAHDDAMNALNGRAHDLLGGASGYHPQASEHVEKALVRQPKQSREHHVKHLVAWASSGDARHHPTHHEIAKHDMTAVHRAVKHHYPTAKIEPVKGAESSDPNSRHVRVSFDDAQHESFVVMLSPLTESRTARTTLAFRS